MFSECAGQINLFEMFGNAILPIPETKETLSVGDKIGRVVLGECRIATITKVEGLPKYPFYRTDSGGCYSYEEGLADIEDLMQQAEQNRMKYKTVVPQNLEKRITVQHTRTCDGRPMFAQIGIFSNMLFWKDFVTYQFLEPYDSEKKLMQEYEKHKKEIMKDGATVVDQEVPMRRLYWSKHGFYADAEYVQFNG